MPLECSLAEYCGAMSEETLELARRGYEAWNRGDEGWFLDRIDDDFVLRFPSGFLVLDEVYRGRDGWRRFWGSWRDAWEAIEIRVRRLEDLGGEEALAIVTFEGVGRGSGASVRGTIGHRLTFRGGRFVALTVSWPRDALEAAGLRVEGL
jgi:ketosteroid isomerase-like protein